jgi:protein ImuB
VSRIVFGMSRPLREPGQIARILHERLGVLESRIDAGYGFDLVRLSVRAAAAFDAAQIDLAGEEADGNAEAVAILADRVRARLGDEAFLGPLFVESHIPERAVIAVPFSRLATAGKDLPGKMPDTDAGGIVLPERPIRLFSMPESVDVTAEVPEGPPLRFRWRNAVHTVARSEGPERIAPEWWRDGADARTRDYFRVEDEDGRRYWIFRQGLYGATKEPLRWFMHGIFA